MSQKRDSLLKELFAKEIPKNAYIRDGISKHYYTLSFFKNNRWNKKLISLFYSKLNTEDKNEFREIFLQYHKLNKTNQIFIDALDSYDSENLIKISDKDFLNIVDAIAYLKKEGTIKISNNSIAEALKIGFETKYSVSYINDKLRLKNAITQTSIESRIQKKILSDYKNLP